MTDTKQGGKNGCGGSTASPSKITDLHVCMGLNSCAGQDTSGKAVMAGTGSCATVSHACHGANDCRGQGACGYLGTAAQQGTPGANQCRGFGSCAVPINRGRVNSAGVNKGKSVWRLARQLFEQRMLEAGIPYGPSPDDGVGDDVVAPWAETNGCGAANPGGAKNGCGGGR